MRYFEFIDEDLAASGGGVHRGISPGDAQDSRLTLGDYTDTSRHINSWLHNQFRGEKQTYRYKGAHRDISNIDQELSKYKLKKPLKVFSGVIESPAVLWEKYKVKPTTPIKAHLPAYTSTTTKWDIATKFTKDRLVDTKKHAPVEIIGDNPDNLSLKFGGQILYITVPAGYSAVSLIPVSTYKYESEILLPRGLDIVISPNPWIKMYKGFPYFVWQATVTGHNPIQITK